MNPAPGIVRFPSTPRSQDFVMAVGVGGQKGRPPLIRTGGRRVESGQSRRLFRAGEDGRESRAITARGQADAPARFFLDRMIAGYENLFADLLKSAHPPA